MSCVEAVVTAEDIRLRRAAAAVSRALASGPDDDAHLQDEALDALATGTIDAVDREWAEAHLATCARCEEDLADRRAVQRAIDAIQADRRVSATAGSIPAPRRRAWVLGVPLGLGAAAAIVLAVALQRDRTPAPASGDAARAVVPAPADSLTPEDRALVARVLAAGRVEVPDDIAFLRGREGTLLGSRASAPILALEGPVGTVVADARPELRWSHVDGARSYVVHVYDEQFAEIARAEVTTTAWTLDTDLVPGTVYSWQVTARRPSGDETAPVPPQPEARFRVLAAAEAEALARLRAGLTGDPLARGIIEARAGLLVEAARSFREAQAADATRATALLASLPARQ